MADEIAQVCQVEIQGITMVVKGTVQVAQWVLRMLKCLLKMGITQHEKHDEKKLEQPGKKSFEDIMKLSKDGLPQALEIREEDYEEFCRLAEKNGLHYFKGVDFIPGDGKIPVIVPLQEMVVYQQIYKSISGRRLQEDKKVVDGYDSKIAEAKEKLHNAEAMNLSPEEIEKLNIAIENYTQAREEADKWVKYDESVISSENIGMSLQDYLRQAKGTEFEANPEKAMAEYEKGVEAGRKMSLKECFQPIRDKSYMPKSQLMFYLPDMGSVVTRKFYLDEEMGIVYSKYALKTKDGEVFEFSDRNMTKAKWNEEILPGMLDKVGAIEGTQCRVFDTLEKLQAYNKFHDKVRPESEINIEKAIKEGKEVFSSAENRKEIEYAISEKTKGLVSARIKSDNVVIKVNPEMLTIQEGKIHLKLNENESIYFKNVKNPRIDGGMAVFEIGKDDQTLYVRHQGNQILNTNVMSADECSKKIQEAFTKANTVVQSQKNHR